MRENDRLPKALEEMFENPSIKKLKEIKKGKVLTKVPPKNTGFVSPLLLGSLICILTFVGMVVSYFLYLIVG